MATAEVIRSALIAFRNFLIVRNQLHSGENLIRRGLAPMLRDWARVIDKNHFS